MRRIRYQVACSLDGYITGPQGEIDWILMDPEIDFGALMAQFDTLLMGRRTYETLPGGTQDYPGMRVLVFSRTLDPAQHPGVTIVTGDIPATLDRLRAQEGKDIWLFGGGELFRSLFELGYVDTIEPAIIPVVLGGGQPMLPSPGMRRRLQLTGHRVYATTGIVILEYEVLKS
jgi:dihydrofolate reductase